jgi:hypothetical protein
LRVVIVDRRRPDIFAAFAAAYKNTADVRLLYDRRSGVERRASPRPSDEASPSDRRGPLPESWSDMHCVVLKQERF